MEKGDAKLCDELLQASAGDMQGLELSCRTRLEFDGVFRMAWAWNPPRWVVHLPCSHRVFAMSWCLSSFAECVMCDPARYCSDCCLSDCNPTLLGRIEKCELAVSVPECCR